MESLSYAVASFDLPIISSQINKNKFILNLAALQVLVLLENVQVLLYLSIDITISTNPERMLCFDDLNYL